MFFVHFALCLFRNTILKYKKRETAEVHTAKYLEKKIDEVFLGY